jgi:pimeloyl-ACP methyl ester carboxylesterase
VVAVAERLPTPPVVIGHSMGGFVVQKYLETHQAPAGVLLASIPPRGLGPPHAHTVRRPRCSLTWATT